MDIRVAETGSGTDAYEAVATKALSWTLRYRGLPARAARAAITKRGGGLDVTLHLPPEATKLVRDIAAVRVVGALRTFDPEARYIDVACPVSPRSG